MSRASAPTVDGNTIGQISWTSTFACGNDTNWGAAPYIYAGSDTTTWILRSLLRFDLKDVPAKATITTANLTLSYIATSNTDTGMRAHRVNQAWTEGASPAALCGAGTGASWKEASPGARWRTQDRWRHGRRVRRHRLRAEPGTHSRATRRDGRVQPQGDGPAVGQRQPNHGLLLKQATESRAAPPG